MLDFSDWSLYSVTRYLSAVAHTFHPLKSRQLYKSSESELKKAEHLLIVSTLLVVKVKNIYQDASKMLKTMEAVLSH